MVIKAQLYIARLYWQCFFITASILLSVVYLFDAVELMRRASRRPDVDTGLILQLTLLKLPEVGLQLLGFAALLAAAWAMLRLVRTQEVMVLRASGVSLGAVMLPMVLCAGLVGVVRTTVLQPFGNIMQSSYQQLDNALLRSTPQDMNANRYGVWIRGEMDTGSTYFLYGESVVPVDNGWKLAPATLLVFSKSFKQERRIDATTALLQGTEWDIQDGWETDATAASIPIKSLRVPSNMTPDQFKESLERRQNVAFWDLPKAISLNRLAGAPVQFYILSLHRQLSDPLLFGSLTLLVTALGRASTRKAGTMVFIPILAVTAFFLFIVTDVIYALGISDTLPAWLAAWLPAVLAFVLGGVLVMHADDTV